MGSSETHLKRGAVLLFKKNPKNRCFSFFVSGKTLEKWCSSALKNRSAVREAEEPLFLKLQKEKQRFFFCGSSCSETHRRKNQRTAENSGSFSSWNKPGFFLFLGFFEWKKTVCFRTRRTTENSGSSFGVLFSLGILRVKEDGVFQNKKNNRKQRFFFWSSFFSWDSSSERRRCVSEQEEQQNGR